MQTGGLSIQSNATQICKDRHSNKTKSDSNFVGDQNCVISANKSNYEKARSNSQLNTATNSAQDSHEAQSSKRYMKFKLKTLEIAYHWLNKKRVVQNKRKHK